MKHYRVVYFRALESVPHEQEVDEFELEGMQADDRVDVYSIVEIKETKDESSRE